MAETSNSVGEVGGAVGVEGVVNVSSWENPAAGGPVACGSHAASYEEVGLPRSPQFGAWGHDICHDGYQRPPPS